MFRIKPYGYRLLGSTGIDGIRVLWTVNGDSNAFVESLAFNKRVRLNPNEEDNKISSYTTSVSAGCALTPMGVACKFCKTGLLPFKGSLSAYEIALQNILMVVSDLNCPNNNGISFEHLDSNKREFAYMGQGEPGFAYPQIRQAILLTDIAMEKLGQKVHRHLISTAGVPEMIELAIHDINNKTFSSSITLHFSLHVADGREKLMPIDKIYPFNAVINKLSKLYDATGVKPCVSILKFNDFKIKNHDKSVYKFNTDTNSIDSILRCLDNTKHRISICEHNSPNNKTKALHVYNKLVDYVISKGFEVKLFGSFGSEEHAACGLLSANKSKVNRVNEGFASHYKKSTDLLKEIIAEYPNI